MKKINIDEIKQLAKAKNAPFLPLLIIRIIQSYLGGLNNVLLFLMLMITGLFVFDVLHSLVSYAAGLPGFESILSLLNALLRLTIGFAVGIAVLYIEYLYSSKGSSFLTEMSELASMLCPDKNADHRRQELQKTMNEVTATVSPYVQVREVELTVQVPAGLSNSDVSGAFQEALEKATGVRK